MPAIHFALAKIDSRRRQIPIRSAVLRAYRRLLRREHVFGLSGYSCVLSFIGRYARLRLVMRELRVRDKRFDKFASVRDSSGLKPVTFRATHDIADD